MSRMDTYNYWNDSRVRSEMFGGGYLGKNSRYDAAHNEIVIDCETLVENGDLSEDHALEARLPTKWVVCGACDGRGTMVNPSIDASGISAQDFYDDPEFAEDYFGGAYDQQCSTCKGRTTVPEPVWQDHEELREAIFKWDQDEWDYVALCAAERAMGA